MKRLPWTLPALACVWLTATLLLPRLEQKDPLLAEIDCLLLLAVLVNVPLALALVRDSERIGDAEPDKRVEPASRSDMRYAGTRLLAVANRLHPFAALCVVASSFLATGWGAAMLCAPWVAFSLLMMAAGLARVVAQRRFSFVAFCCDAGLLYLPIGAAWLVLSRLGAHPLGFGDVIVLLTALHFHYSGFVAPILVAQFARLLLPLGSVPPPSDHLAAAGIENPSTRASAEAATDEAAPAAKRTPETSGTAQTHPTVVHRKLAFIACGIVIGTPLLAAGITFSWQLEVVAALWIASALSLLGFMQLVNLRRRLVQRPARILLCVSSLAVVATMLLAATFALQNLVREPWVSIPTMVHTHGWLNALGFAFCGLLAWTLERCV